jgi:hypothetical protein
VTRKGLNKTGLLASIAFYNRYLLLTGTVRQFAANIEMQVCAAGSMMKATPGPTEYRDSLSPRKEEH